MPCQITPSQMGVAPPERSPVLWRWNISQTTTTPRTLLYSGAKTKFYQKWDVFVGAANTVMPRRIYLHFALFTTQSRGWGTQLCEKKSEYCQNFIHFLTHKSICLAFIWLLSVQDQMLDISDIAKSGELWNDFNFNVIAPQVCHVNDGNISISIWSWNLNIWPMTVSVLHSPTRHLCNIFSSFLKPFYKKVAKVKVLTFSNFSVATFGNSATKVGWAKAALSDFVTYATYDAVVQILSLGRKNMTNMRYGWAALSDFVTSAVGSAVAD